MNPMMAADPCQATSVAVTVRRLIRGRQVQPAQTLRFALGPTTAMAIYT